jgi:hypothetical protein
MSEPKTTGFSAPHYQEFMDRIKFSRRADDRRTFDWGACIEGYDFWDRVWRVFPDDGRVPREHF